MPPPSGGSGMKVLFIVLGVVFIIALIGVAAVAYLGFYVKNRVERAAKDYGIEASSRSGPSARRVDPCSLISKEEAGEILGVAIERTETDGEKTCQYFAKALTQEEREQAMAKLQSQDSAPRDQKDVENMAKAMVSAMAGGAGPSFGIEVEWDDGRTMLNAFKFVIGTAGGGDAKVSEKVSGIGDEAVLGPMASMLMFVKGSTGVQIDLRMVPDAREKGVAIAKIVAGRLVPR
jgi:hypothetical protein